MNQWLLIPTFPHDSFADSYDEAIIKLTNAEVQIEDLKLQLDDALAAEDMVVRLTERNLMLGEVNSPSFSIQDLYA